MSLLRERLWTLESKSMGNLGRTRIKKGFISGRGNFFRHVAGKTKAGGNRE